MYQEDFCIVVDLITHPCYQIFFYICSISPLRQIIIYFCPLKMNFYKFFLPLDGWQETQVWVKTMLLPGCITFLINMQKVVRPVLHVAWLELNIYLKHNLQSKSLLLYPF